MSSLFNEPEDTPLRTRRGEQAEYASEHPAAVYAPEHDREVTLNTGMVLAIFFALVLVCAVFFGFGYSIGHKSGMATAAAAAPADTAGTDTSASTEAAVPIVDAKPAAGSPTVPSYVPKTSAEQSAAKTVETHTPPATEQAAAPVVRTPPPAAATAPIPEGAPGGTTYVQIAAVSHQEDADVLLSALSRRGYKVITRSEPADKLIHVQIGPFANRKDADAMKQRLLADGYNAFLK